MHCHEPLSITLYQEYCTTKKAHEPVEFTVSCPPKKLSAGQLLSSAPDTTVSSLHLPCCTSCPHAGTAYTHPALDQRNCQLTSFALLHIMSKSGYSIYPSGP
eukprot:1158864-Pelagomonas_calceolata.AAC.6